MSIRLYLLSLLAVLCLVPCVAQHQKGKASYYSKRATGARTASGARLHHDSLTCAHRSYPFGTMLKVTNLSNNKSVVVKVTDRGPFGRGRIIDLSYAAAKEIGMLAQGIASVKIEPAESQIPMRPEPEVLPMIDFEMAESPSDFIETWKAKGNIPNSSTPHKQKTQQKDASSSQKQKMRQQETSAHKGKTLQKDAAHKETSGAKDALKEAHGAGKEHK